MRASAEERSTTGLNLMLLGMVIGIGPLAISILYHAIFPHAGDLPGERFWNLTGIAIPIGLALALMKLEGATAEVKAGGEATA
jgi:hypothetical protein